MSTAAKHAGLLAALSFALLAAGADAQPSAVRGVDAVPSADAAKGMNLKYHALVIGIDNYRGASNGTKWADLRVARQDAEAVAGVLKKTYGFQVTSLYDADATREKILAALDGVVSLTPDDALLIYYAGHGHYDEKVGEGFWIPSDARQSIDGRPAKEDWIWNSMITKILGATEARHVLVIADACYGGSLFRGGEPEKHPGEDVAWYGRAITKPSRYLITSGDLEPVLDGDTGHSIFAREVLNYLQYPDEPVFSASDLALAVRGKVSQLTGQMVRMGPMPLAADAGGEMVFVREGTPPLQVGELAPRVSPAPAPRVALQDAVALSRHGAVQSAEAVLARASAGGTTNSRLFHAVAEYVDEQRASDRAAGLHTLIAQLSGRAAQASDRDANLTKPRIVACIGPTAVRAGDDDIAMATLYRLGILADLQASGGARLVEREELEQVLQELDLGASALADQNAKLTVGRLLPASLLLTGQVISTTRGDRVIARLVDTETSELLGVFSDSTADGKDVDAVCADLAQKIRTAMVEQDPLTSRVGKIDGAAVEAPIGSFHGATAGMTFDLLGAEDMGRESRRTNVLARVTLRDLGEKDSTFDIVSGRTSNLPEARDVRLIESAGPTP